MTLRPVRWLRRLAAPFTWTRRDRDMDEEMTFHLDSLKQEYLRPGMSAADAEHAARARFGNLRRLKDRGHDVRSNSIAEHIVRDVKHVARGLRKTPGFTVAVVLTLAVAIGGNTAIFSVVDQLLLRPLPYPDGDRLLMAYEKFLPQSNFGRMADSSSSPRLQNSVSPANWLDWMRESQTVQSFAAWREISQTLTGAGEPTRVSVQIVSAEFFPLLGVQPFLGRTITDRDDIPNAPAVAVLSHRLWQSRFGGASDIVGRIIRLNDGPVEVIGVMPPGFRFMDAGTDLWSAYRIDRGQAWRQTAGRSINVVARLQPGVTLAAARTELEGIAQRLAAEHPFNKNTSVELVPLREDLTGEVHTALLVLYGAVGVLLLIACFNVANLLLARGASRRREMAICASLGAGRLAIIRQLLVESVMLSVAGGAVGTALAIWCVQSVIAFAPADLLSVPDLSVDLRVLAYTVAITLITGLVVGLAPALLVSRESIAASVRSSGVGVTQAPRIRQILVVSQVAMTVILLCGAGLLVRTVVALSGATTGVDTRDLLTMQVQLSGARYQAEPSRRIEFFRQAVEALRQLPGVESAAAANSLAIIGPSRGGTIFRREGTPKLPMNESPTVVIRVVTQGYFQTLGIPLLRGREFSSVDDANPVPGFVVNEAFVKTYLADVDPLGVRLSVVMSRENPYAPILGVVGNVKEGSVRASAPPTVFYTHRMLPEGMMTLIVRTRQPATTARPAVDVIHRIDPNLAVTNIQTFEGALADSLARERLSALVSAAFALSGLLLASFGLYGLLAFLVTERTKEIGVRIALGAHLGRLTRSYVGGGLRLVAIGGAIGVAGSLVLLRSLSTLLFGVTPYDMSTYAAVLLLLCTVAALASYLPARRAARIEPLRALRQE